MFVFSNYLNNRRDKMAKWRADRKKFEKSDKYEYHWQLDTWDKEHPKPVKEWADVKWPIIYSGLVALMILCSVGLVVAIVSSEDKNPKTSQTSKQEEPEKNCKEVNKNDYVRIQTGGLKGATGIVIGGCAEGQAYQIRLEKQMLEIYEGSVGTLKDVTDWVVPVGHGNIVKIDKSKDK